MVSMPSFEVVTTGASASRCILRAHLTQGAEQNDRADPYRGSRLYLIARAFEGDAPAPLLGLAECTVPKLAQRAPPIQNPNQPDPAPRWRHHLSQHPLLARQRPRGDGTRDAEFEGGGMSAIDPKRTSESALQRHGTRMVGHEMAGVELATEQYSVPSEGNDTHEGVWRRRWA